MLVAIFSTALVALAGVALASPIPDDFFNPLPGLTATADTVQTNGNYIGIPTLINGETYTYGYKYTLMPDGTYTVMGTITNELDHDMVVAIAMFNKTLLDDIEAPSAADVPPVGITIVDVPAAGSKPASVGFSVTVPAGVVSTPHDIFGIYVVMPEEDEENLLAADMPFYIGEVGFSDADYVDAPQFAHTVDQGPMSNMVLIYTNGHLSSNASVIVALNQTSDEINALYSGGKFDFQGSPLYSFAE